MLSGALPHLIAQLLQELTVLLLQFALLRLLVVAFVVVGRGGTDVLLDLAAILRQLLLRQAGYVRQHGLDHGVALLDLLAVRCGYQARLLLALPQLLLLLQSLDRVRQLALVRLVERLLLVDLLDGLRDLPQRVVLLPRAERLEDHRLGALVATVPGQIHATVAVLGVNVAVVREKQVVIDLLLRADILVDLFLVKVHEAVRAQKTVLLLFVVRIVVVSAIAISIHTITVFIICIVLLIVVNKQLLLLIRRITISIGITICMIICADVVIFDQFLIGNVPLLARQLVQLLVLVGRVEHDAMLVVRFVVDIVVRRVLRMVLFILLIMSKITVAVALITTSSSSSRTTLPLDL